MDLGKENRGRLDQSDPYQLTTNGDIVTRHEHLCMVCALRKHDFEIRAPEPEHGEADVEPIVKASIDGLPYRSVYHLASQGVGCTDCGERVIMTYDPEQVSEPRVALCKA